MLLAWKQRYFQLNSIGLLKIYETVAQESKTQQPIEVYNLMGARVTYEQNRVISLDDGRGNSLVFRCFNDTTNQLFQTWKSAIDSQIIDRSETLWVRPNEPLSLNTPVNAMLNAKSNKVSVFFSDLNDITQRPTEDLKDYKKFFVFKMIY